MATVDEAIDLLRDPRNLRDLGDPRAGLAVNTDRVVELLHARGAQSEQEARTLIRAAARSLGGDEVVVSRRNALRVDLLGSGQPAGFDVAFWVPRRS